MRELWLELSEDIGLVLSILKDDNVPSDDTPS